MGWKFDTLNVKMNIISDVEDIIYSVYFGMISGIECNGSLFDVFLAIDFYGAWEVWVMKSCQYHTVLTLL